jgi:cell wall-associated NlpC family hydrolase
MRRSRLTLAVCVLAALPLTGCATIMRNLVWMAQNDPDSPFHQPRTRPTGTGRQDQPAPGVAPVNEYRTQDQVTAPLSADEKAVLASAKTLLGQPPDASVNVNGRAFTLDCIGTVSAIYYGVNVDVQRDFSRYDGNGVNRLYQSLKALKGLHRDQYPRPGDVIFWDNTWDANGDGNLSNDPRTHAGVVISVDDDGTIHYEHEHVRKGVIVETMNLLHPDDYYDSRGRVINNALALNSGISRSSNPPHWTSGSLFDAFGDVLRNKRHYVALDPDAPPPPEALLAMRPPEDW